MSHLLTHPDKIKGRGGLGRSSGYFPRSAPIFMITISSGEKISGGGLVTARPECSIIKKGGGTPPSNGFSDTKKREGKVFCKSVITDSGVFIGGCLTVF